LILENIRGISDTKNVHSNTSTNSTDRFSLTEIFRWRTTALSLQSVEIESFNMCEMKLNERTAKYGYLYQPLLTAVIVTTLSLVMVFPEC
jgi:hypothetical protein